MTSWTVDVVPEIPRTPKATAVVLEAAGGLIRTVMAHPQAQELLVAVLVDNPMCQALLGKDLLRVIRADGQAFMASASEVNNSELAQKALTALQDRLGDLGAAARPARVFRLVLDSVAGMEQGLTPRT